VPCDPDSTKRERLCQPLRHNRRVVGRRSQASIEVPCRLSARYSRFARFPPEYTPNSCEYRLHQSMNLQLKRIRDCDSKRELGGRYGSRYNSRFESSRNIHSHIHEIKIHPTQTGGTPSLRFHHPTNFPHSTTFRALPPFTESAVVGILAK
jgi:hypothetical protein